MNLDQTTRWRDILGRAGALFCLLFLIAAIDGLALRFREPENVLNLLPGNSVKINGFLGEEVKSTGELAVKSNSPAIQVSFETLHRGFWLGGNMWRGLLTVGPGAEPGDYSATVGLREKPAEKPLAAFIVHVHQDRQSLLAHSKSFLLKYLGLPPWKTFAAFFLLTLLSFGAVFLLSHRRGRLLALEGQAEIYRIVPTEGGASVAFGLGTAHGIRVGDRLPICDERGAPVGIVQVHEVSETDAVGTVETTQPIKPGYLVKTEKTVKR